MVRRPGAGAADRDTVKLRGVPKASATKQASKDACGRGNDLGYGNNAPDATMDDPQPSPKSRTPQGGPDMGAVQRLNGGGRCCAALKI